MLERATGFDWDEGNSLKNWEKHGVTTAECEEVFFSQPLVMGADEDHSRGEDRFYVLGRTSAGREESFSAATSRRAASAPPMRPSAIAAAA